MAWARIARQPAAQNKRRHTSPNSRQRIGKDTAIELCANARPGRLLVAVRVSSATYRQWSYQRILAKNRRRIKAILESANLGWRRTSPSQRSSDPTRVVGRPANSRHVDFTCARQVERCPLYSEHGQPAIPCRPDRLRRGLHGHRGRTELLPGSTPTVRWVRVSHLGWLLHRRHGRAAHRQSRHRAHAHLSRDAPHVSTRRHGDRRRLVAPLPAAPVRLPPSDASTWWRRSSCQSASR